MAEAYPAEAKNDDNFECPICKETYCQPKLLPCAHTVCKKCILSWLKAEVDGGCPLCRSDILPANHPGFGGGDGGGEDIVKFVDDLPTNLVTVAMVECQAVLAGDDVCTVCDVTPATSFCLNCFAKLCASCSKAHTKLSVTRDHVLEDLGTLTVRRLATSRRALCDLHPEKSADLYCQRHHALLCVPCFSSCHSACTGVKDVERASKDERKLLTDHARSLSDKDATLAEKIEQGKQEIQDAREHFQSMGQQVKDMYDRLQQLLDKRRHVTITRLQQREQEFLAPRESEIDQLEKERTCLMANANAVKALVSDAGDGVFFGMMPKLKARFAELEKEAHHRKTKKVALSWVWFDPRILERLQQSVAEYGQLTDTLEMVKPSADSRDDDGGVSDSDTDGSEPRLGRRSLSADERSMNRLASAAVDVSSNLSPVQRSRSCDGVCCDKPNPVLEILSGLASGPVTPSVAEAFSNMAAKAVEKRAIDQKSKDVKEIEDTPPTSGFGEVPRTITSSETSKSSRSASTRSLDSSPYNASPSDYMLVQAEDAFSPQGHSESRPEWWSMSRSWSEYPGVSRRRIPDDVFSSDFVPNWSQPERIKSKSSQAPANPSLRTGRVHGESTASLTRRTRLSDPGMQRVRRGPDWSELFLESLDGSPPSLGTVIQVGEGPRAWGTGWVSVRWNATGRCRWYRMGAEGKYDVQPT